jgi:hypothetical protein
VALQTHPRHGCRAARRAAHLLGGTNTSLTLGGTYSSLNVYGCGAAGMEGEVMQPFAPASPGDGVQVFNPKPVASTFTFTARFTGDSPFGPKLERATAAAGPYQPDTGGLIESLGGGVYRITTPMEGGNSNEFFRITFNQP